MTASDSDFMELMKTTQTDGFLVILRLCKHKRSKRSCNGHRIMVSYIIICPGVLIDRCQSQCEGSN